MIRGSNKWLDNANWDIYIVKLPRKSKALVRQKNGEIKEYTVTDIKIVAIDLKSGKELKIEIAEKNQKTYVIYYRK